MELAEYAASPPITDIRHTKCTPIDDITKVCGHDLILCYMTVYFIAVSQTEVMRKEILCAGKVCKMILVKCDIIVRLGLYFNIFVSYSLSHLISCQVYFKTIIL